MDSPNLPDKERRAFVNDVLVRIARLADRFSLRGLSTHEADLLAGVTAIGVIENGGHVYWYEGKGRLDTLRAVEAFERLGLANAAQALRSSLDAFPDCSPPDDLAERQRYVSAHRKELEARFADLDESVWGADFTTAAFRFIQRYRSELARANPELAAYFSRN